MRRIATKTDARITAQDGTCTHDDGTTSTSTRLSVALPTGITIHVDISTNEQAGLGTWACVWVHNQDGSLRTSDTAVY